VLIIVVLGGKPMKTVDDFWNKPIEPLHPRLRNWKNRLADIGTSATLEVYRPETEFGQSQPEMNLQFTKDRNLLPLETVPWDDDLNAGLILLGVRAATPEQESERFALGLRAALRKAEREFGDGYFNAVLVELLKDSGFTRHAEIAEVLKHVFANRPHREGGAFDRYTICRDLIANAIRARRPELTDHLGYPQETANGILVSGLARYLDERFSVSNRRRLGLL
jgi:hypothetical protein